MLPKPEEYAEKARALSQSSLPSIDDEVDELILVAGDREWDERVLREKVIARRQKALMFSFVAMVFISLANAVFKKLETVPMYNYPNFLNLWTTFMYIPFSFAYIIPMIKYGSAITRQQQRVPKRVFAIMGLLDGVAGIMQIFASTYLSGSMLILLSQAAIPISMAISKKILRTSYITSQYAGAAVVALGIIVVLGPSITAQGSGQEVVWGAVMIVSCIPMVLSNVYKEMELGEAELDPIYLNGWVAVFQFGFSIILAVPAALAGDPTVSPRHLPENIWDGFKCFLGLDSVKTGSHPDHCWPGAPLFVSLYLIFNITYNILIILMLKFGSSNIMFLALTTTVPLGNVAFSLKFMPGHSPMRSTDVVGLIAIMAGLVLYRFGERLLGRWGREKGSSSGSSGGGGASGGDKGLGQYRQPLLQVDEDGGLIDDRSPSSSNGGLPSAATPTPFSADVPAKKAQSVSPNRPNAQRAGRGKAGAAAAVGETARAASGAKKDDKKKSDKKLYHL